MDTVLSLVCQVQQFLERHAINPGRMVVAVSGGPDSVALLRALLCLCTKRVSSAGPDDLMVLAHFNHQLRGAESDGDAAFVQQLHEALSATSSTRMLLRCAPSAMRTPMSCVPCDTRYDITP